jgi:hypothetical protein
MVGMPVEETKLGGIELGDVGKVSAVLTGALPWALFCAFYENNVPPAGPSA